MIPARAPLPRLLALAFGLCVIVAALAATPGFRPGPRSQEGAARRAFQVSARKYAFTPSVIEVRQDDLIRITLRSEDIPHGFTVDEYRIAKRVGAGQTVTFEFRADRAGTFSFYCNLSLDEGCRNMRGQLIVRPR
jgi:cytochrome c oxidase subunit 2